jgi:urease accessory protein
VSSPVLALLLADSRTPTGGYAHSAGLEPAVAAGLTVAEVPSFLAARLETVAYVEAAVAASACDATARPSTPASDARSLVVAQRPKSTGHPALPTLLVLDDELAARTPSAPQRSALRQLGRALLRVGERLWPGDPLLEAYVRESAWTPRPIALGLLAARAGLSPQAAARLSLYEDAAGVAAAALKLLPLDPAETTAWVAGSAERIDELAEAAAHEIEPPSPPEGATPAPPPFVAAVSDPAAAPAPAVPGRDATAGAAAAAATLPATSTPLFDLRSLDHERLPGRNFVT